MTVPFSTTSMPKAFAKTGLPAVGLERSQRCEDEIFDVATPARAALRHRKSLRDARIPGAEMIRFRVLSAS
jgi:hypothetical protein